MSLITVSTSEASIPQHVLMVRPLAFRPNEQTANDNRFQQPLPDNQTALKAIAQQATSEFDAMVQILESNRITVSVFEATDPNTPDAIFPNNWLSTHSSGLAVTYPMYCENRRAERREDVLSYLSRNFDVKNQRDLSALEKNGLIVEGTGAMVIDHFNNLAYVCLSQRANREAVKKACDIIGLTPICFNAYDSNGDSVYHTNVMMSVGSDFAIVASDMIAPEDKGKVISTLQETGKTIVHISEEQVNAFAGNCLELLNKHGQTFLVLSKTAHRSLNNHQIAQLPAHLTLLPIAVPTIEMAGGSVRCMMADIHLSRKQGRSVKTVHHAREQDKEPNVRIRLVQEGDLDNLLMLAKAASPGMTTFPPDAETLDAKLKRSLQEAEKLYRNERPEYLLFVLEDLESKVLIGTSAIFGELGKEDSFYSYKREKVTQRNTTINAHYSHEVLHLSHHYEGYAEVASLFLLPEYRKGVNGKLLTKVRYLFMGLHQSVFPKNVMADLRGYVDKKGQSPFWEAVGRHFFPMTYAEADLYGAVNGNQFIADLMPKLPLYVNMLPEDAKAAIGRPHDDGRPAMALLEKEGFKFTNYIDIFDGAPSMEAEIAGLKTVQMIRQVQIEVANKVTQGSTSLIATLSQPFYAMVAKVNKQGDIVVISRKAAQALNVNCGDTILLSEL